MKLYAISDLHISHPENMEALSKIGSYPEDWLMLGGDVCETVAELEACFQLLTKRFAKLFWVPGNHELWTTTEKADAARGEKKYLELVALCRKYEVATPEDEYVVWPGKGPACTIAPLFLLYDYSFRGNAVPTELDAKAAIQYSLKNRVFCVDEELLHSDPYASRSDWCRARVDYSQKRLSEIEGPLVILNHFPLREEDASLPMIPTFILWCGTQLTADWPERFPIHTAVHGHLHIRRDKRNQAGQRFVDVSLGYPRQRAADRSIDSFLVEILPGVL